MKEERKYVFIGNRFYVYKKMKDNNLNIIKTYVVKNSFLSRYLDSIGEEYVVLNTKKQLTNDLMNLEFDVLVSNGCPYILPISDLKKHLNSIGKCGKFINVHTSLLPDCKGRHPVNAALLFGRRHGVTCHYMDDGIDTGKVIDQIEIPITDDVSLNLLYKISFLAEGDVFEKALKNNFEEKESLVKEEGCIYYSRHDNDMYIRDNDSVEMLLKKVRAFSADGMYAKIKILDQILEVKSARIITNPYIKDKYMDVENKSVCLIYADCILTKMQGELLEFTINNFDGIESFENQKIILT